MATPFQRPPDVPAPQTDVDPDRRWDARLFGPFRLLGPDGSTATPVGRKARALVAYLFTTGGDGAARERLAGLLWSERGEDQARASLRQTFYELRTLTSGDAAPITIDRARVALVEARVTTDSARLDEAARADDAGALAALVGDRPAEFLADLDGIDPAFDDWLSVERTRRRDGRRRALLAVADRRLAAGDADAAQQLSDRLLACDPADEAAARIAMQASHRRGDRDAVRGIFASLADALRRQISVEPSDETHQVYRRLMAAQRADPDTLPALPTNRTARDDPWATKAADASAALPHPARAPVAGFPDVFARASAPRRSRRWTLLAAAAAMLTVVLVEVVGWWNAGKVAAMQRVLRVAPMQVAPNDAAAAALWSGFSAELAHLVVGRPDFVVRDAEHGSDEAPERTFVIAAAAQSQDGVLHVGLRLLGQKDGPILWSTTLTRPVGEVAALREQMAAKVADVALCALDGRRASLRAFRPQTLQLLLGACDLRHSEPLEAARLLERLTREMPGFGHGWALLAAASAGEDDATRADGTSPATQTEAYARRAIDLDPHDGDAYLGRAFALQGVERWPQRMAILHEGQAMDPDNADLAAALAYELARLGRLQEAIAWSERAIHADPFSPIIAAEHAKLLGLAGTPFGPDANLAFDNARRRFGADAALALAEFRFDALNGDHRRAAQMLGDPDRGFHLEPVRAALWRALIETRADPSAAHDAAAERAFVASMRAIPEINFWTLETLSFLHRVDEAYAYADRMPARALADDVADSLFSEANRALRADPRFMTLAARVGLAAIWKTTDRWPDFCSEPGLGYDCRIEATRALSDDPRPLLARR
jgi:DNA-binding SARP family transcriptional activator/tetratricopeptide (TPR) repeat protein